MIYLFYIGMALFMVITLIMAIMYEVNVNEIIKRQKRINDHKKAREKFKRLKTNKPYNNHNN